MSIYDEWSFALSANGEIMCYPPTSGIVETRRDFTAADAWNLAVVSDDGRQGALDTAYTLVHINDSVGVKNKQDCSFGDRRARDEQRLVVESVTV